MGADPRTDDARWLLDWITRTNQIQFSRRDAHMATPRGRFPKATDLEPALSLLEEHRYLRRVDPEPSRDPHGRGRPASPRFLVNPRHAPQKPQNPQEPPPDPFLWILWFLWRVVGAPTERPSARRHRARRGSHGPLAKDLPAVTLSNENSPSRSRPSLESCPAVSGAQRPADAPRRASHAPPGSNGVAGHVATPRQDAPGSPWARNGTLQPQPAYPRP